MLYLKCELGDQVQCMFSIVRALVLDIRVVLCYTTLILHVVVERTYLHARLSLGQYGGCLKGTEGLNHLRGDATSTEAGYL